MPLRPNLLFLMTDQMQARVLDSGHPCLTPSFGRLAARGVRFTRAYTPNAVCSPARASLMTGLLPHNHGVLEVTHCTDPDQSCLRPDKPHWAQHLSAAGYRTGYFGKWHVERSHDLGRYGWEVDGNTESARFREHRRQVLGAGPHPGPEFLLSRYLDAPPGYDRGLHYAVTRQPPEKRGMGLATGLAATFLEEVCRGPDPWCCFVSVNEPHDPFVCGEEAFRRYRVDDIPLAPNVGLVQPDAPGLYRKAARAWAGMTDRQRREAAACYYATITEIDAQFGRLLDLVEKAGRLQDTIVVLTADHGELLGAHGLYCKNVSGYEEVYNIPLVVAGPGVAAGALSGARVGLHDLCPTLLELVGLPPITVPDSRSVAAALADPTRHDAQFTTGLAEYHGTRYRLTQRVYWDGNWKFAFNGFDFDELYNLAADPYEMRNLALDPAYGDQVRAMMTGIWRVVRETNDHALLNSHYPILRLAPFGPATAAASPPGPGPGAAGHSG